MRSRSTLALVLLVAVSLSVLLPTALTAMVAVHLALHHSEGHDHAAHHRTDHDHRHRMDAAAKPDRLATMPPAPALPKVKAMIPPVVFASPAQAAMHPAWESAGIERRGPPAPAIHLHCSLLL